MSKESSNPGKRHAVFLDRDGVLSRSDCRDGKPYAPTRFEDFELMPDAIAAGQALKKQGFLLIVITNQPDVGNGLVDKAVVERMNAEMARRLPIDAIKVCYHAQTEGCECRKPKPGMILSAAKELAVDLASSFMIGDRWSDISAGHTAGCRTVFIDRDYTEGCAEAPDFTTDSLASAAEWIIRSTT